MLIVCCINAIYYNANGFDFQQTRIGSTLLDYVT